MKAIVLTYDKNRALTEHMIFKYQQLWPDHPFCFRIPYQELKSEDSPNCEYIHSPVDIKGTVLTLIQDLDDDDWIYWCIDDKYPIYLDLQKIKSIMSWLLSASASECSGVLFCRIRDVLTGKALKKNWIGANVKFKDSYKNTYLHRTNYEQIWLHQFLRVKVIRYLFEKMPDIVGSAKTMDALKYKVRLPESHLLLVYRENIATFGESTSRNELTLNCYESIVKHKLELPELALNKNLNVLLGSRDSKLTTAEKIKLWSQNLSQTLRLKTRLTQLADMN